MKILVKNEQLLHEKFVMYGASAKSWMRQCVMLLPEINRRQIWKQKGFGSIYEYAAKLAGMSRNTVDDALRILEKIEDKPNLLLVAQAKGLGAIRPVITTATLDDEKFWAQKAAGMSKHTLETYVREFKKQEDQKIIDERHQRLSEIGLFSAPLDATMETFGNRARPGTDVKGKESEETVNACAGAPIETATITMDLDPKIASMLLKLKGHNDWNTLMQELLEFREEKLKAEEPEPAVQRSDGRSVTRYIPTRIKNHVLKKTNGQCAYPGCAKPYQILHHTQRFALEKTHDPQRLVPLCKGHEAIAHHGLIKRETQDVQNWRLRKNPAFENPTYAIDRKVMSYRKPV